MRLFVCLALRLYSERGVGLVPGVAERATQRWWQYDLRGQPRARIVRHSQAHAMRAAGFRAQRQAPVAAPLLACATLPLPHCIAGWPTLCAAPKLVFLAQAAARPGRLVENPKRGKEKTTRREKCAPTTVAQQTHIVFSHANAARIAIGRRPIRTR